MRTILPCEGVETLFSGPQSQDMGQALRGMDEGSPLYHAFSRPDAHAPGKRLNRDAKASYGI